MKAKWEATPFPSLESAHKMAERMQLYPGDLCRSEDGRIRFFQFSEGRELITIAQSVTGGPVKEKKETRGKRILQEVAVTPREGWVVGPWVPCNEATLADTLERFRKSITNPDNVEVIPVSPIHQRDVEYEYTQYSSGVWGRVYWRSRYDPYTGSKTGQDPPKILELPVPLV